MQQSDYISLFLFMLVSVNITELPVHGPEDVQSAGRLGKAGSGRSSVMRIVWGIPFNTFYSLALHRLPVTFQINL